MGEFLNSSLLAAETGGSIFSGPQLGVLAVVVIITSVMLVSTRRKLKEAQNSPRAYSRELYSRLKEEQAACENVQEVMLQLEQLARQIHGQIDTKFAKLEAVIRDADRRIEQLNRLATRQEASKPVDVTIADDPALRTRPTRPRDATSEAPFADIHRLADAGMHAVDIARETARTPGEVELILALRKTQDQSDLVPSGLRETDEQTCFT